MIDGQKASVAISCRSSNKMTELDVLDKQTEVVVLLKPEQRTNPVHDHWTTGCAFVQNGRSHLAVCLDNYSMT